jgi:hypothetical protein
LPSILVVTINGKVHAKKAMTVAKKRNIEVDIMLPNDIDINAIGMPDCRAYPTSKK